MSPPKPERVLVVGAGALGNEVLKNLALLGVGEVVVADLDTVELSNLSRSVLFRESDEGTSKAECAAKAMRQIYPDMKVRPLNCNVLAELGLGWFHWADVVVGALDNREARVFVNAACAQVGRPWFDGGIEVLQGIVRGFDASRGPCYECTMSSVDWDLLAKRRSCSLLARRAIAERGTPTTPTTASVIGALQAQEVVKTLHGMPEALLGRGFVFDGRNHTSYPVNYRIHPDCPWHEPSAEIVQIDEVTEQTALSKIAAISRERLGGLDALDLSREIVERMECGACGSHQPVWQPAELVSDAACRCHSCGAECAPRFIHSIDEKSQALEKTPLPGEHT